MTNKCMGPQSAAPQDLAPGAADTAKSRTKVRAPVPESLASVTLIDATTCAAVGGMGLSWWHAEVAAGRAPAPIIRQPRCTRWRVVDVQQFWEKHIERAAADPAATNRLIAQAAQASKAARAKRAASSQCSTEGAK